MPLVEFEGGGDKPKRRLLFYRTVCIQTTEKRSANGLRREHKAKNTEAMEHQRTRTVSIRSTAAVASWMLGGRRGRHQARSWL